MSRKLLTDVAFLPLGSQENRPFVNGSSVSAGGRGTAEAVLSCQLLPFQQKPEPSLPKFRSQIEAEIPAACPELSEEHLGKCTDPPQQLGCAQLPSSAHTQAALHHCPPQPLCSRRHRDAPKPSSSSHLQVPHTRLWQQQGNSLSPSQLCKPHPVPEPRVQVQTHPADFPTSDQLMQDSVPCLGAPLRRKPWWVQSGHHLVAALKA